MFNIKEKMKSALLNDAIKNKEDYRQWLVQMNKEAQDRLDKLDDTEIICTEWLLKSEAYPTKTWCHSKGYTGGYLSDYANVSRSIMTVGTEKQEALLMRKLEVQVKDSWRMSLPNDYKQLYLQNNKQALLINLK